MYPSSNTRDLAYIFYGGPFAHGPSSFTATGQLYFFFPERKSRPRPRRVVLVSWPLLRRTRCFSRRVLDGVGEREGVDGWVDSVLSVWVDSVLIRLGMAGKVV